MSFCIYIPYHKSENLLGDLKSQAQDLEQRLNTQKDDETKSHNALESMIKAAQVQAAARRDVTAPESPRSDKNATMRLNKTTTPSSSKPVVGKPAPTPPPPVTPAASRSEIMEIKRLKGELEMYNAKLVRQYDCVMTHRVSWRHVCPM